MHRQRRFTARRGLGVLVLCVLPVLEATAQEGVSTMGHARARRLAELGRLPVAGDIVIEDVFNYHTHDVPRPRVGEAVALDVRWGNPQVRRGGLATLQIGLATAKVHDLADLPPVDVVVVVDRSGSMEDGDKLTQVKRGLEEFVRRLRPGDRLALVSYDDESIVELPLGFVGDGARALRTVQRLETGGATNLHAGLMTGFEQFDEGTPGCSRRLILLTDGIANRGVVDVEQIVADAVPEQARGIDVSTIGVGIDFQRDLLKRLSESGSGLFHFVADAHDIDKVFVQEVQGLLSPSLRDVRLEFDTPPGLAVEHIYGYAPEREGSAWSVALRDLNAGATQVVLVDCRVERGLPGSDRGIDVRLRYEEAGVARVASRRASVRAVASDTEPLLDSEVRKNVTLAQMADAMHDMAVACDGQRYADAEGCVTRALASANRRYPTTEDEDLLRVRAMLEGYRKTLRKHIEWSRDL